MDYLYQDKAEEPNLDGIHTGIASSDMTDKSIKYCRWDADIKELKVVFESALSTDDKAILDGIVESNS